jgi:hypothetical protein
LLSGYGFKCFLQFCNFHIDRVQVLCINKHG